MTEDHSAAPGHQGRMSLLVSKNGFQEKLMILNHPYFYEMILEEKNRGKRDENGRGKRGRVVGTFLVNASDAGMAWKFAKAYFGQSINNMALSIKPVVATDSSDNFRKYSLTCCLPLQPGKNPSEADFYPMVPEELVGMLNYLGKNQRGPIKLKGSDLSL